MTQVAPRSVAPGPLRRLLSVRSGRAVAALAAGLSVVTAWVAWTGVRPHDGGQAMVGALAVSVPVGVGLFAWDGTHARFARALVAVGLASFIPPLAASANATVYSVGRVGDWITTVAGAWLALAFPPGRLVHQADRALVALTALVVGVLYLPTALLVATYPVPTQWTGCVADCPPNAFKVASSQPAFLVSVVFPLRELLIVALFVAIPMRLGLRIRRAPRLTRLTLTPVLVASIAGTLGLAVGIGVRHEDPSSPIVRAIAGLLGLWIPAVSIGFLIGILRWRVYVADALQQLGLGVRDRLAPEQLQALASEVLADPNARLLRRDGNGVWRDIAGAPVNLDGGGTLTELGDGDAPAGVLHNGALAHERSFVQAVGAYAFMGDENRRMAADAHASLRELAATRASLLAAWDAERRRIERDIHDSAQQRLLALGIRLHLADELMDTDPAQARALIHDVQRDLDDALDEVRSLAIGIYPQLLAKLGLAPALRELANRSPAHIMLKVPEGARFAPEIEVAVYFCCSEAVQNAMKHAPGAAISLSVSPAADLTFEVCDDGPGFDSNQATSGHGLVNMRQRLEAVGGGLTVRSARGRGTCVTGRIPLRATAPQPPG
jgi:signal transduction histidine kinase